MCLQSDGPLGSLGTQPSGVPGAGGRGTVVEPCLGIPVVLGAAGSCLGLELGDPRCGGDPGVLPGAGRS